jgi:hypothetical protein
MAPPDKGSQKISISPAALPLDFLQQNQGIRSYQHVDVDLGDAALLRGLSQTYPSLPLSRLFLSGFCASVFRITGQDTGALGLLSEDTEARRLVGYAIDEDTTP